MGHRLGRCARSVGILRQVVEVTLLCKPPLAVVDVRLDDFLGSREQEGRILRIDPTNGGQVEPELDSRAFLRNELPGFRGGKLVAYNRFVLGRHPKSGEPIHWVTVAGGVRNERFAAWLMIRNRDASYEIVRVFDPDATDRQRLATTRTLEYAPWDPNEFYTGGYDGAANQRKNHNTAWIYRGFIE